MYMDATLFPGFSCASYLFLTPCFIHPDRFTVSRHKPDSQTCQRLLHLPDVECLIHFPPFPSVESVPPERGQALVLPRKPLNQELSLVPPHVSLYHFCVDIALVFQSMGYLRLSLLCILNISWLGSVGNRQRGSELGRGEVTRTVMSGVSMEVKLSCGALLTQVRG